jgi:hypothetical protein
LLLAFVAAAWVEQALAAHPASLPLIRLAPALLMGGLLTLPLRERWSFAALALVGQMMALRLANPVPGGWAIMAVALCTVAMGVCGMARLLRRTQAMRDHMGHCAPCWILAAAAFLVLPLGLANATLGQGARAWPPARCCSAMWAPLRWASWW